MPRPVVTLLTIVLLPPLLAAGCSSADGYELVRAAGEAKAQCERELTAAAQQACEARYQQDFEGYREARREVLDAADDEPEAGGPSAPRPD